jgi:hypothetical protein
MVYACLSFKLLSFLALVLQHKFVLCVGNALVSKGLISTIVVVSSVFGDKSRREFI